MNDRVWMIIAICTLLVMLAVTTFRLEQAEKEIRILHDSKKGIGDIMFRYSPKGNATGMPDGRILENSNKKTRVAKKSTE